MKRKLKCFGILLLIGFASGCGSNRQEQGFIEGRIHLAGKENHEAIQVFIPGTSMVAFTDQTGYFKFEHFQAGTYELCFRAEGYDGIRKQVELKKGEKYQFPEILELQPLLSASTTEPLQGKVSLDDGSDPSGTYVIVQRKDFSTTVILSATGGFSIPNLEEGLYEVNVFRPDYIAVSQIIEVLTGELMEPLDIVLSRGRKVSGKFAENLAGIARLEGSEDSSGILVAIEGTTRIALTDPEGRFLLDQPPPEPFVVAFQRNGYESLKVKSNQIPVDSMEEWEVVLPKVKLPPSTGAVDGFVQFEGGYETNLAGVEIQLIGALTYKGITQRNGKYVISAVNPGVYRIEASVEGYEPFEILGVSVKAGETTHLSPLVLTESPKEVKTEELDTKLSGTALLDGKQSYEGIMVKLSGTPLLTTTDADGIYNFYEVPSGIYDLSFFYTGYRSDQLDKIQLVQGQSLTLGPITLYQERDKPYILFSEPSNGTRGVPVKEYIDIVVVFSTRMQGGSVKKAVKIAPQVAHEVFFGGEHPKSDTDRMVIRLIRGKEPTIQFSQEYTLSIDSSAQDLFGIKMEKPYEFSFTTSGPLIVNTMPKDGAEDVFFTIGDYIIVDFNDDVDYSTLPKNIKIRPRPDSEPILFPENIPVGSRAKFEVTFKDDTNYEVTLSKGIKTRKGVEFENTPYRFSFRTGSIQNSPDTTDDLIFTRDNDYK